MVSSLGNIERPVCLRVRKDADPVVIHSRVNPDSDVARCGWRRTSFTLAEPVPFHYASGKVTCPECRARNQVRTKSIGMKQQRPVTA